MRPPRLFQDDEGKIYIMVGKGILEIKSKDPIDLEKIQEVLATTMKTDKTSSSPKNEVPDIKWNNAKEGITDRRIDKIMKKLGAYKHGFQGSIAADEINIIKPTMEPFSFIINNGKRNEDGEHWIAVYVDPKYNKSLEVYDSFGRESITSDKNKFGKIFMGDIKTLIDKLKLPYLLKFKENLIPNQSAKTGNCGYFSMRFILNRIAGRSFKEASGYNDLKSIVNEKESEITIFKKGLKKFGYI